MVPWLRARCNFDINYRFPGATTFTGLHIHNGAATVAGPVIINTGLSGASTVVSDTGFGNVYPNGDRHSMRVASHLEFDPDDAGEPIRQHPHHRESRRRGALAIGRRLLTVKPRSNAIISCRKRSYQHVPSAAVDW